MKLLNYLKNLKDNDAVLYRFKNCSDIYSTTKKELLKKELTKENRLKVVHQSYNFIVIDFI